MEYLNIFNTNIDFNGYFLNQLTLSSTLLGLLIATSAFILQSGFTSFEYSRSMFLKYYVKLSKFLFLLLGYNIIISLVFLYFKSSHLIAFGFHLLFGLVFIKYLLDFYSHKGYILTISSNKSNPRKNRIRKYFRYIYNLGFINVVFIISLLFIVISYPILIGKLGVFSERQGFVSTLIAFVFCVVSLIRIMPQYFNFSEQEYSLGGNKKLNKVIDISQELVILKNTLVKNGRKEIQFSIAIEDIAGKIEVRLSDKKDEAFFVINIYTKSADINKIVRWIEKYSYDFFIELNGIHIDVNSFVLSYFIEIESVDSSKMFFIRSNRTELSNVFSQTKQPKEFVKLIENKVIDELFRSV